jgi:UDP-N-acetylmuramyl pentapeptide phosphotransferase/UDP-N-acetylglucosamine-1-phosphate transferase
VPLLLFIIVLALNLLGIHQYLRYAQQKALLDTPNARSSHEVPTVRGGGLLFAPTFIALLLFYAPGYYLSALALALAALISFLDDLYTLPVRYRLPAHFLSVALLIYDTQSTWPIWAGLLALILITGWLNTFNFMDGINGISAVYAAVLLGSFFLVPLYNHAARHAVSPILPGMLAAILAFSWFNFRKKALCFAGDIGSVSLALILAWALLMHWYSPQSLYLLTFPALYAVDSVMTILVRLRRGENIFEAHRTHLYQLLANERGWDHRIIALLYGGLQLSLNITAVVLLSELPFHIQLPAVISLYLLLCGLYFGLRHRISAQIAAKR